MTQFLFAAVVWVLGASAYAAGGVVITMKTTSSGGAAATSQIQLDSNHMRTEMARPGGPQNGVIFDGVKQVMYVVDNGRKTYSEISKADIDRMAAQVQSAMANIPPEQRARMEAMMRGRGMPGMPGMGAPAPKPVYRKTGTDAVGKWACDKYEGFEGDRKTSEVCTVDPKALGLSTSDFDVTKQFAKFFSSIMPQRSTEVFSIGSLEDRGFVGVPVRSITYGADGSPLSTTELSDIVHQSLPESTFAPPAGFEKQDMGFGRGRGRG